MHHVFYLTGSEIAGGIASVVAVLGLIGGAIRKRVKKTKHIERMTMSTKTNIRNEGAVKKLTDAINKYRREKNEH